MQWVTDRRDLWGKDTRGLDPIKQVEEMIACWELQRAGRLEEFHATYEVWSVPARSWASPALADLFLRCAADFEEPKTKIKFLLQAARAGK